MGRGNLIQNSLQLTPFNRSRETEREREREVVDFAEEFRERCDSDRFAYNFSNYVGDDLPPPPIISNFYSRNPFFVFPFPRPTKL